MRFLNRQYKRHIRDRAGFELDVVATLRHHGAMTETDLQATLRGSWQAYRQPAPGCSCWSFGAYDFRSAIGRMVNDGLIVERRTYVNGSGVTRMTHYSVAQEDL